MRELFAPMHIVILSVVFVAFIVPYWQILKKAGFAPALSLLIMVPVVGLVLLYYVAFSDWKRSADGFTSI